jgi:hypothetical protein
MALLNSIRYFLVCKIYLQSRGVSQVVSQVAISESPPTDQRPLGSFLATDGKKFGVTHSARQEEEENASKTRHAMVAFAQGDGEPQARSLTDNERLQLGTLVRIWIWMLHVERGDATTYSGFIIRCGLS